MIAHRLYRALPKDFRLRLVNVLPPHRRLWLVRRLTRLGGRRSPAPIGAIVKARDAGSTVHAVVSDDATPAAVWRRNLDAVVTVLDAAGIDYFCFRHTDELRSAIGVASRDRGRTMQALRDAPELAGATVEPGDLNEMSFVPSRLGKRAVRVYFPVTDPYATTVLGAGIACEVEFWRHVPGIGGAPDAIGTRRRNAVASLLPAVADPVPVSASTLTALLPYSSSGARYRSRPEFAGPPAENVAFPIDAVYTWVDGSDPDWVHRKNAALAEMGRAQINEIAANQSRFTSRDELRYSLRSIVSFAPWVRRIFVVTDDQLPPWLDETHPMVTVVSHRELFGATGKLPTFNSHAIESRLHHILGLAEHFIYFNDDMFLGRPLRPTKFFHGNGIAKFFQSNAQLEAGPPTVFDAPVTAAGKNNRSHIEDRFQRTITQKMQHVPYALQKSVLQEIEDALPDEVLQTAAHQFRHPLDLSIPSSLQHYWAYYTSRAVPGTIKYTYADLAHPSTPVQLAFLLARRHCDVFCLNDTDSAEVALAEQAAMLKDFLPRYFPFRAPFELPDDETADRAALSASQIARRRGIGATVTGLTIPQQATRSSTIGTGPGAFHA
jgi:hypothetical protein